MNIEEKEAINLWDHLDDFLKVYEKMKKDEWDWWRNPDCKYVELRNDMRDGGCLIKNREGKRINPEDLEYQYSSDKEAHHGE